MPMLQMNNRGINKWWLLVFTEKKHKAYEVGMVSNVQ